MPTPSLDKSLAELAGVVKRLNDETENLNATISNFEETLLELSPGIVVWCEDPIRRTPSTSNPGLAVISHLGFTKHDDTWGLWIRRGAFVSDGQVWKPGPTPAWRFVRLTEASREERVKSIELFP